MKPTRTAEAFAARAMMSRMSLLVVAEGRVSDRPYYERVIGRSGVLPEGDFAIYLAEDISLNGIAAGGKKHLLALHDAWKLLDALDQESSSGRHSIAVCLDRDYDDFTQTTDPSRHMLYTMGADAEADILHFGLTAQGIADTYSLTTKLVEEIFEVAEIGSQLAALWRGWITLGVKAEAASVRVFASAKLSQVNSFEGCGPQVSDKYHALCVRVDRAIRDARKVPEAEKARRRLRRILLSSDAWQTLKGRWIAKYVKIVVESNDASHLRVRRGVPPDTLTSVSLGGMDSNPASERLYRHYAVQISRTIGFSPEVATA